jgi:GNAT superfamily N-acetyltransferase
VIREATLADVPAIFHVRTSVRENHLSVEQMAARGITHESVGSDMAAGHLGAWIAEIIGQIVAFGIADRRDGKVWALFTLPEFEGRGLGTALLVTCEDWLREQGLPRATLDTARDSSAHGFYLRRGYHEYQVRQGDPLDVYLCKAL